MASAGHSGVSPGAGTHKTKAVAPQGLGCPPALPVWPRSLAALFRTGSHFRCDTSPHTQWLGPLPLSSPQFCRPEGGRGSPWAEVRVQEGLLPGGSAETCCFALRPWGAPAGVLRAPSRLPRPLRLRRLRIREHLGSQILGACGPGRIREPLSPYVPRAWALPGVVAASGDWDAPVGDERPLQAAQCQPLLGLQDQAVTCP